MSSEEEYEYGSESGEEEIIEGEEPKKVSRSMKDVERTSARGLIFGTGGSRTSQSEEDKFMLEMNTILNANASTYYKELIDASVDDRLTFFSLIEDISNIEKYNSEIMVTALYFIKYIGLPITKENISIFKTQLTDREKIDLVRYIRMLSHI